MITAILSIFAPMTFFSAVLSKFLSQYINKVNRQQVDSEFLKGHVELNNMSFTPNVLSSFGIPLHVKDSKVGKIAIDFPSFANRTETSYLKLENADFVAQPEWSALNLISINSVSNLIQLIQDEKETTKLDKKNAWNSWFEKIIDTIKVDLENIRIYIEFSGINGTTHAITFFLGSLSLDTGGSVEALSRMKKKPETLTKIIQINNLSIGIHPNVKPIRNLNELNDLPPNLLLPFAINFTLVHDRRPSSEILNTLNFLILEPIKFTLNREQFCAFQSFFHDFQKNQIRQKFQSCYRPSDDSINQEMWLYFYRCAIKIRRPHNFKPSLALQFLKQRESFSQKYMKKKFLGMFAKKSIKKYGEELTYLLIQYSSILEHRNQRMITITDNDIDSISAEDCIFFSKNSLQVNLIIKEIVIDIPTLLMSITDNMTFSFSKIQEQNTIDFQIQKSIIDDRISGNHIFQILKENESVFSFQTESSSQPALISIASFDVSINSSFLKRLSDFFRDPTIKTHIQKSEINNFLLMLNPKTSIKFQLKLNEFSVHYFRNDQHSFYGKVQYIQLQNFPNSNDQTSNLLQIIMETSVDLLQIDGVEISNQFTIQSTTNGHIDEYYYLDDIETTLDISNAKFRIDSQVLDKVNEFISSVLFNSFSRPKRYSNHHKIFVNCQNLFITFDSGYTVLILQIAGIDAYPCFRIRGINVKQSMGKLQISIPMLDLEEWPILKANELNINLNSVQFFEVLDSVSWLATNLQLNQSNEIQGNLNQNLFTSNQIQIMFIIDLLNYNMGDESNSMKINHIVVDLKESINIQFDSFAIYDRNNQKFLFIDNQINFLVNTTDNENTIIIKTPTIQMNFLWEELHNIIDYFKEPENKPKQIELKETKTVFCIEIGQSKVNVEDSFILSLENIKFELFNSNVSLFIGQININNFLLANDFNFHMNDYVIDLMIKKAIVYLSPENATKLVNLSFLSQYFTKTDSNEKVDQYFLMKFDLNIDIHNFEINESSNYLMLVVPTIRLTLNCSHSICVLYIPSINFETFNIKSIELFLLFNGARMINENIESLFVLSRSKSTTLLELTSLFINVTSIDFEYSHYLLMRLFHSIQFYRKIFKPPKQRLRFKDCEPRIMIKEINLNEHNLSEKLSLVDLSLQQTQENVEIKCHSMKFIGMVKKKADQKDQDFFVIHITNNLYDVVLNSIDIYLNIDKIKMFSVVYESLLSLSKAVLSQEKKKPKDKKLMLALNGIRIHFPFEDDPLFQRHDLSISFNFGIEMTQMFRLFHFENFKVCFTKIDKLKQTEFLSLINNTKIKIGLQNTDFNLQMDFVDLNFSVLDIIELKMIVMNMKKLFRPFFNPTTFSEEEKSKKYLFQKITTSPIDIKLSFCEENRGSLRFTPLFVLTFSKRHHLDNLISSGTFHCPFDFSIMYMNQFHGQIEPLLLKTQCQIDFSYLDPKNNSYAILLDKGIDITLTTFSLRNLITLLKKFQHQNDLLLFKKESEISIKSEYWINNNLDKIINLTIFDDNKQCEFFISPCENMPFIQISINSLIKFKYKNIEGQFTPSQLIFPTYFHDISLSVLPSNDNSKTISFSSLLSIENKLDCVITLYIKDDKTGDYFEYKKLLPHMKYPLPIERTQYYISSDFEYFSTRKSQRDIQQINIFKSTQCVEPEPFYLSNNYSPQTVKIIDFQNRFLVSFNLLKVEHLQTNTIIYEIIPSFVLVNHLPCPIFTKISINDTKRTDQQQILIQHGKKKQISFFSHNLTHLTVSLGFTFDTWGSPTTIQFENDDKIYECDCLFSGQLYHFAIQIVKDINKNIFNLVIYTPCMVFNELDVPLNISNNIDKSLVIQPHNSHFFASKSYFETDSSLKMTISKEGCKPLKNAIDCMCLNSICTTILLPSIDKENLYYPINCSITLARFPLKKTRIVTFTPYLYVINNLPFTFILFPIISNESKSIGLNDKDFNKLHDQFEREIQTPDAKYFLIENNSHKVLVDSIPLNNFFLLSIFQYSKTPFIQFNNLTRTIFVVHNHQNEFYQIELNIIEKNSTLYAYFQPPSFPAPLVINNSLDYDIEIYQNINPFENKHVIQNNTTSIFAYDEPFMNDQEFLIKIKENLLYFFSMEEQLSPINDQICIETKVINKNGSKMISIYPNEDKRIYKRNMNVSFSISSFHLSLNNQEMQEIALFSFSQLIANLSQDSNNTIATFSIETIEIDDQSFHSHKPICLLGTGQKIYDNNPDKRVPFIRFMSVFPRGVPLFTQISYMNFQIEPIYITFETKFIVNLILFAKKLLMIDSDDSDDGKTFFEPSFNSFNENPVEIAYLEISPLNLLINIPKHGEKDEYGVSKIFSLLNMISSNTLDISTTQLFISEFNNNPQFLFQLLKDFYGTICVKRIIYGTFLQLFAGGLLKYFKFIQFHPLMNQKNDKSSFPDNRKPLFTSFNEIELNTIADLSQQYFGFIPKPISELIDKKSALFSFSNIMISHQNNELTKNDHFLIGIVNNSNRQIRFQNKTINFLFKTNQISRSRFPRIFPIFSSFSHTKNADVIHQMIQEELLNHEDLKHQIVKFIIQSKLFGSLIFVITDQLLLFFNDTFKICQKSDLMNFHSVTVNHSIVSLKENQMSIDQIDIDFPTNEEASKLSTYIKTQQKMMKIFGHILSS